MPILDDTMDHPFIGRERKIGKRFGPVPAWAAERIESLASPELEKLATRVLDAPTLEDLFA
jgi:hypothetical protein